MTAGQVKSSDIPVLPAVCIGALLYDPAAAIMQGRTTTTTRDAGGEETTRESVHGMDEAAADAFDAEWAARSGHLTIQVPGELSALPCSPTNPRRSSLDGRQSGGRKQADRWQDLVSWPHWLTAGRARLS